MSSSRGGSRQHVNADAEYAVEHVSAELDQFMSAFADMAA